MPRPARRKGNRGGGFEAGNNVKTGSGPHTPHKPWLLRETDPGFNDQRLCPLCRTINLRWILRHPVERVLPSLVDFGSVDAVSKRPGCPLCRLVITALCTAWGTDDVSDITELRSTRGGEIQCKVSSSEVGAVQPLGDTVYCLEVFTNAPWIPFKSDSGDNLKRIMLLDEDAPQIGQPPFFYARRVRDQVDVSLLRKWLDICESQHGERCGRASGRFALCHERPRGMNVIDGFIDELGVSL